MLSTHYHENHLSSRSPDPRHSCWSAALRGGADLRTRHDLLWSGGQPRRRPRVPRYGWGIEVDPGFVQRGWPGVYLHHAPRTIGWGSFLVSSDGPPPGTG